MKQKAVEFLIEQLFELRNPTLNQIEIMGKAKEMQKQQQDEYAIGFIKWIISHEAEDLLNDLKIVGEIDDNVTPEQLLKIYKKEKWL